MKSILLIDDDKFVTTLYAAKLQSEGFVVDTAHSGNEAIEKLEANRPDIIILDLNMPGISGVELLRAIRAVPQFQQVPVIIFSSAYIRTLVDEATQLGVNKILAKSQCPPKMLISEVKKILDLVPERDDGGVPPKPSAAVPPSPPPAAPPPKPPAAVPPSPPPPPPKATVAGLSNDAIALLENPTTRDIPALLDLFISCEEDTALHILLVKIYKASLAHITRALAEQDNTVQGQLGRALEKLMEDLYANSEHITGSTKQTLVAGLRKLSQIYAEKPKPTLESEQALKDLLRSLEE